MAPLFGQRSCAKELDYSRRSTFQYCNVQCSTVLYSTIIGFLGAVHLLLRGIYRPLQVPPRTNVFRSPSSHVVPGLVVSIATELFRIQPTKLFRIMAIELFHNHSNRNVKSHSNGSVTLKATGLFQIIATELFSAFFRIIALEPSKNKPRRRTNKKTDNL